MIYTKDTRELEFYETALIELVKAQIQRSPIRPEMDSFSMFVANADTAAKKMIEKRKNYIRE
jgi:hypothetical protein